MRQHPHVRPTWPSRGPRARRASSASHRWASSPPRPCRKDQQDDAEGRHEDTAAGCRADAHGWGRGTAPSTDTTADARCRQPLRVRGQQRPQRRLHHPFLCSLSLCVLRLTLHPSRFASPRSSRRRSRTPARTLSHGHRMTSWTPRSLTKGCCSAVATDGAPIVAQCHPPRCLGPRHLSHPPTTHSPLPPPPPVHAPSRPLRHALIRMRRESNTGLLAGEPDALPLSRSNLA